MDKLKRYKFKNQFWNDIQPIGVIAPDGKWVEYAEARAKTAALESENAALKKRCAELERRCEFFSTLYDAREAALKILGRWVDKAEDRADRLTVIADALAEESWQNHCHSCNKPMSNYCPHCQHLWET